MLRLDQIDAISDSPIVNLFRNGSCEGGASTDYVSRRNLNTNPHYRAQGATRTVRTNLVNQVQRVLGSSSAGVALNGKTWVKADFADSTNEYVRYWCDAADLVNGQSYTFAVEVYNPNATAVSVRAYWTQSIGQTDVVIPAGATQTITITGARSTYDTTWRFADVRLNSSNTVGTIYLRGGAVIAGTTGGTPFDGTYAQSSEKFTYSWTGTAYASKSVETAYAPQASGIIESATSGTIAYQVWDTTINDWIMRVKVPAYAVTSSWGRYAVLSSVLGAAQTSLSGVTRIRCSQATTAQIQVIEDAGGATGAQVVGGAAVGTSWTDLAWQGVPYTSYTSIARTRISISNAVVSYDITYDVQFTAVYPGGTPVDYFDGATPAVGTDYRYSWEGAADASVSAMKVDVPTGFAAPTSRQWARSNQWASDGQYALRVAPYGNSSDSFAQMDGAAGMPSAMDSVGRTFTVSGTIRVPRTQVDNGDSRARKIIVNMQLSTGGVDFRSAAAPNAPGVYRLSVTFTVPADMLGWNFIRFYNGDTGSAAQDVWWDELMMVEGTYSGPYVDGDDLDWVWDGVKDASSSRGYAPSVQRIRNRVLVPNAQTTAFLPGGWTFPSAGGSGTASVPATGDGIGGRLYARKTFDGVTNGSASGDLFAIASGSYSGTVIGGTCRVNYGTQYVMSVWVRSSITNVVRLEAQGLTYTGGAVPTDGANITLAAGVWTRLVLPFTPTQPNTVGVRLDVDNGTAGSGWVPWPAGSTFDVSCAMITEGTTVTAALRAGAGRAPSARARASATRTRWRALSDPPPS